jgi:chromopyrrolic acid synthase
MSILDFPRLHFRGAARIHAPTGQKNGLVDLSTNEVYMEDKPFDLERPPSEYHDYLDQSSTRFNAKGEIDEQGVFSSAKGWDFGGNGHFAIDAKIVSRQPFELDQTDLVVGRSIDFWGHYNEYLGTTFNRARVFDCDPTSNWTTTLLIGQLAVGRAARSHDTPYLLSAPIEGTQPARWQNFDHIYDLPEHYLNAEFKRSAVHQFTISKADEWLWSDEVAQSPTVLMMREAMHRPDVLGLVVQFGLSNMSTPLQPDLPVFWELHGTIGLWYIGEMRSYPHGRFLIPRASKTLSNLTVQITPEIASLNLVTAVPCTGRSTEAGPGPTHAIAAKVDLGNLELRTLHSQRLIAQIPSKAYQKSAHDLNSGIIDVALVEQPGDEPLCITNEQGEILIQEKEINLQVDDACLFLEFPKQDEDFAVEVEVRSFVRGRPAAVDTIYMQQFYNPKASRQEQAEIVTFAPKIATNEQGYGRVKIKGVHAGTARILLSDRPDELLGKSPTEAYDNDDLLGFWSGAGAIAVRVLTNDWHLEEIPAHEVDFALIYKHILAYYELCFSFMKAEVFSLADKCKVETYARLMWQMSDPNNCNKTYYMPPTRDMSYPKAMLLRKFLDNQQQIGYVPEPEPQPKTVQRSLQTRDDLVLALKHAAELEIAVMLQYIYAAYSIPNYATGEELVKRGRWTPEQLQIACGDGKEVRNYGMRGVLLEVSHEEMIHFLMVNNILMAMGEPFYAAIPNFSEINQRFPIETDFALEPFNATTIQRFMRFEYPDFLEEDLTCEVDTADSPHTYGSLSELYRQIREGIETIPDLFVCPKKNGAGGEHHLFLRENIHKANPDYQYEVDDVKSALFAIDVIVEQGEGCDPESPKFEKSHFQQFRQLSEALATQQMLDTPVPWNPAYPALRNPTLEHRDRATTVVTVPETRKIMQIHDQCYFLMMQMMVQHFGYSPHASLRRSKWMNAAIDVMTGMMRPLGELLMTLPSGKRGKTAGPAFEIEMPIYMPDPAIAGHWVSDQFAQLAQEARACEAIPSMVYEMFDFYNQFFADLAKNPS